MLSSSSSQCAASSKYSSSLTEPQISMRSMKPRNDRNIDVSKSAMEIRWTFLYDFLCKRVWMKIIHSGGYDGTYRWLIQRLWLLPMWRLALVTDSRLARRRFYPIPSLFWNCHWALLIAFPILEHALEISVTDWHMMRNFRLTVWTSYCITWIAVIQK